MPSVRWRAIAAGAAAVAVVGAGCSEGGGAGGDGGSADSIKVVMAQYSSQTQEFWTDVVASFEEENPDIDVQLQVIDWNTLLQQVPTWTQTQAFPDVLNFNAYSQFANEDLLHPISEVADAELQDDMMSELMSNAQLDGTAYALPILASVRSLGYNEQILSEIGVSEPPSTWDELVDVARQAENAGYTGYCLPLGAEESQAEWSMWMWSNGGGWKQGGEWSVNSQENLEALEFLRGLANEEEVTEPNPGKVNRTDGCWEQFAQGRVAMTAIMPLGTFQTSFMEDSDVEWASAPFPRSAESVPEFTLGVTDFLMSFQKPGNAEPVGKFFSYVYERDRYLEFIESEGFLPVTKSASEAMADDPVAGEGISLLPKARFYPATDPAWNQVQKAVQSQLGTAMEPNTDPQRVLDDLQETATQGG